MPLLFLLPLLLSLFSLSKAQFFWGFPTQNDTNSLSACDPLIISIFENSGVTDVQSPFYLYSYPLQGIPSVQLLQGQGLINLTAQVLYPSQTQVIFSVYDSQDHNGGWGAAYTIQSSSDTSCLSTSSNTSLSVSLNSTSVSTCDTVLLSINGGTPPYTVNVIPNTAVGSVAPTTNTTMPSQDSYFGWVADVTAGSEMLVGVRDANGFFSETIGPIKVGGQNATCTTTSASYSSPPSSSSSGGNSGNGSEDEKKSSNNAGAIAGGVIGGLVLAVLIAIFGWWLIRRNDIKRSKFRESTHGYSASGTSTSPLSPLSITRRYGHKKGATSKSELDPEMYNKEEANLGVSGVDVVGGAGGEGREGEEEEEATRDSFVRGEKATAIVDPYLPPDEEVGEGGEPYPVSYGMPPPSAWRRNNRDFENGSVTSSGGWGRRSEEGSVSGLSQGTSAVTGGLKRVSSTAKSRPSLTSQRGPMWRVVNQVDEDERGEGMVASGSGRRNEEDEEALEVDEGVLAYLQGEGGDSGSGSGSRDSAARRKALESLGPSTNSSTRRLVQHEDGGMVPIAPIEQGEEDVVVLPPTYDSLKK